MQRQDERDATRRDAAQHALLAEALAMAARAKPEAIQKYVKEWRAAKWLDATAEEPPAPKPDPLAALMRSPYFRDLVIEATQPTPIAKPEPATPEAPVYRVERTRRSA